MIANEKPDKSEMLSKGIDLAKLGFKLEEKKYIAYDSVPMNLSYPHSSKTRTSRIPSEWPYQRASSSLSS